MKSNVLALICLLAVTSAPAAGAKKLSGASQVVAHLYRDFAWEASDAGPASPDAFLSDQPESVLSRYFDPTLTKLIVKDRECQEKTHEICNVDFLIIWNSQDPSVSDLKITQGQSPEVVHVSYRYLDNTRKSMTYRLRKTDTGWRIADIEYASNVTLLQVLRGK
jgi:hypothetical protein